MLTYHQCGHNFVWNIDALGDDDSGEGLIISPVNVEADRIRDRISGDIRAGSWFDPQFYLPDDSKGKLETYDFFPGNVLKNFSTTDFLDHAYEVASQCLKFQADLGLRYVVIPARYYEDLPDRYLAQLAQLFVEPFLTAHDHLGLEPPVLLTLIAKPLHLERGIPRDEILSWATSFEKVGGLYLIFDNDFYSKQIKDPEYLVGQLRFIKALRDTGLEVHVGYGGLEGLLLSAADPTSVSMGSYENLRSFGTPRLETRERSPRRPPRPRIYSATLLQWIDDTLVPPIRQLVPDWQDLFDESPYKEYLLDPKTVLNFQRSELYKHYFYLFSRQIGGLPSVSDRPDYIRGAVREALARFDDIGTRGVYLDGDSDGSHLPAWMNALAMFEAESF
jgi:hypothetical protein